MNSNGNSSGNRWRSHPGGGRPAAGCETPRQLAGAPLSVPFARPI